MRIEYLPIVFGALVALAGLAFIVDARLPDGRPGQRERRRRVRAERSRGGETFVGLGTLALASSLIGRDTWRYGTLAVLVGAAFLLIGAWMNRRFLREMLVFRGPARRGAGRAASPPDRETVTSDRAASADQVGRPG